MKQRAIDGIFQNIDKVIIDGTYFDGVSRPNDKTFNLAEKYWDISSSASVYVASL